MYRISSFGCVYISITVYTMKTEIYTNRYGDEFTFTELEDGNIQWSGKFEWCRFGFPNNYDKAYNKYLDEQCWNENPNIPFLSLDEFKREIHRSIYDENGRYVAPCIISLTYSKYVDTNYDVIDMVDPSGGPYLSEGMTLMGKTIKEFKPNRDGYLIITEK